MWPFDEDGVRVKKIGSGGCRRFGVGEQRIEAIDPASPDAFEVVEQRLSATDPVWVAADKSLTSLLALVHESCSFQHGDVLLDGSERHVVLSGELRDRRFVAQRSADDVAPGRVGEGPEDPVHLVVTEVDSTFNFYNHLVVR